MRIDAFSGIEPKSTANKAGENQALELQEGNTLKVRVVSVGENGVSLKTEDGLLIRARLEDGAMLSPGDIETLVVTGQEDGVIYMARADENARPGRTAADGTTTRLHNVLTALRVPTTPETIASMVSILEANPDMPLDMAAFLAANKIPVTDDTLEAARALLSGDAKIAEILAELEAQLLTAMENPGTPPDLAESVESTLPSESAMESSGTAAASADAAGGIPSDPEPVVLTDGIPADPEPVALTVPVTIDETQSLAKPQSSTAQTEASMIQAEPSAAEVESGSAETISEPNAGATRAVFDMLRQMPAFRELPDADLLSFTHRLLSDPDAPPLPGGNGTADELLRHINNIFADADSQGALKKARDELFSRLTFLSQALENSQVEGKQQLLEQTQKLINHVKLTDNIDQFVYMQLPVKLGDEQKNAELYIYKNKKRGADRIDPDNVKILLSLDLTHLGHLESFIGIRGKDVTVSMETETDEAAGYFKQSTVTLHKTLSEIGFKLTDARAVRKKGEDTTVITALSALTARESGGAASGIDYMI